MTAFETQEEEYRAMARRHRAVIADVVFERVFQERKWGPQEHSADTWFRILAEEFGEIAKALNESASADLEADLIRHLTNLREEIVQTTAVAVAWLEDWDRRGMWGPR